ncbi:hypothetical protein [Kribbella catacumbae]|uniref:hypothetical protein n=1 Tax=Kribbella catacumbae TaxID=460086 RepID=UPI0003A0A794|nr:hypothetical protein [Kribbella catacumbae]
MSPMLAGLVAQHIAGLPIEELLLAGVAAALPMLALLAWQMKELISRIRRAIRRWGGRFQDQPRSDAAPPH